MFMKEMAIHSSVLAWGIPGTGEPDGLPSMGSHRVGHDLSDLAVSLNLEYLVILTLKNPSYFSCGMFCTLNLAYCFLSIHSSLLNFL